MMKTLRVDDVASNELQNYLNHIVAPRPIALVSTINLDGSINLSPFSFFNIFSINPPICVFSASRRVRDNTTKHTLENVLKVKECVINMVDYSILRQVVLSSGDYPKEVNEFEKAGLTMQTSELVMVPRVQESKVQLECIVNHVIPLGSKSGAGNLIVAEIKLIHIDETLLDEKGAIDQLKTDWIARMGADWYLRANANSLFRIEKPLSHLGMGIDVLPHHIKNSTLLNGNHLGQLGSLGAIPNDFEIEEISSLADVQSVLDSTIGDVNTRNISLQELAISYLDQNDALTALKILLL